MYICSFTCLSMHLLMYRYTQYTYTICMSIYLYIHTVFTCSSTPAAANRRQMRANTCYNQSVTSMHSNDNSLNQECSLPSFFFSWQWGDLSARRALAEGRPATDGFLKCITLAKIQGHHWNSVLSLEMLSEITR